MKVITIIIITITLMLVFGLVFSEEFKPEPKGIESAKVQNAYKTYKAEVAKAQEAIFKAEAAYNASLKQAQSEAMKRGDTAEYEALKEYIAIEPPVVDKDEAKAETLKPILQDIHKGVAGLPRNTINADYNLILKVIPKKKTILIIGHPKNGTKDSLGEILLNNFVVGSWDLSSKPNDESIEIDITEHLTDTLKEFKVSFKYKSGKDGLTINAVKAVYK